MTLNIIYEFCFIRNLNIAARPIMLSDWPKYLLLNNHMGYGNVTWSQPQDTVLIHCTDYMQNAVEVFFSQNLD
jgi:hypothetical protein